MARRRRDTGAGVFHVFTHSVWAAPALYRDDEDRLIFLRELARVTERFGCRCLAYCLMRTHYHALLDVDTGALPAAMHSLNFRYASAFNKRHRTKGHVHGSRYNALRVTGEASLLSRSRYLAWNPPEAGLCKSPEEWQWSSYPATIGLVEASSFVTDDLILGCFDAPHEIARARLRRYVDAYGEER
jgi:hypothetical protein